MGSMEIEAKFRLPDAATLARLRQASELAGLTLGAERIVHTRDIYLDTARRDLLAAGYVCRLRQQDDGDLLTLKACRGARGAIHTREEFETPLPAHAPPAFEPAGWPPGPARERILSIIGQAPLGVLFELRQTRVMRSTRRGEQNVAELSLDEVELGHSQLYRVVEIELAPDGHEDDLRRLANCLQNEWRLAPEPLSKFERALALLGVPDAAMFEQPQL